MSLRLAARTPESARAERLLREACVPRTNTKPASTSSCPGGEEPRHCLRSGRGSAAAGRRRKGSAAELVNITSYLKACQVQEETWPPGHQDDASAHSRASPPAPPKGLGFVLLSGIFYSACQFGRHCLTKPKNRKPVPHSTDAHRSKSGEQNPSQTHVRAGNGSWHLFPKAGAPSRPQPNSDVSKEDERKKPSKSVSGVLGLFGGFLWFFLLCRDAFVLNPRGDQLSMRSLCLLTAPCSA